MVTNNSINVATGAVGTILQGQGVGVADAHSTATYPSTAGTSGNILTSDGTNWSSSPPVGLIATANLTNSQIKNLHTTPITILTNQGSGVVINVVRIITKLVYGASNAFTGSGIIGVAYTNASGTVIQASVLANAQVNGTASVYTEISSGTVTGAAIASVEDQVVVVYNSGTAIGGNVANNNLINVQIFYYLSSI